MENGPWMRMQVRIGKWEGFSVNMWSIRQRDAEALATVAMKEWSMMWAQTVCWNSKSTIGMLYVAKV